METEKPDKLEDIEEKIDDDSEAEKTSDNIESDHNKEFNIDSLFNDLATVLRYSKIENSIVILEHPETRNPDVFYIGDFYENAKMAIGVADGMKNKILNDIGLNN